MDSGSQIDNVQSFFKVIGNNVKPWRLLLGREVVHLDGRRGKIFLIDPPRSEIGVEVKTIKINNSKCQDSCIRKFYKAEVFNQIYPPILYQDLFNIIQEEHECREQEKLRLLAEHEEKERKLEKQRQERVYLEQERREQEKLRLLAEHEEKKRKLEEQRQERAHLEQQRREQERLRLVKIEQEREKRARHEAEKQALLEKLKEHFEQNFLNVDNFYQAQCTEHITFKEYQTEKLSYVQSWVKTNFNSSPDLEQAAAIGAVEGHVQVVARAGSGKTSTLVNRALFYKNIVVLHPMKC